MNIHDHTHAFSVFPLFYKSHCLCFVHFFKQCIFNQVYKPDCHLLSEGISTGTLGGWSLAREHKVVTVLFNNTQTLFNQRFCVSLPSIILADLSLTEVYFNGLKKTLLWVVIGIFSTILFLAFIQSMLVVVITVKVITKIDFNIKFVV